MPFKRTHPMILEAIRTAYAPKLDDGTIDPDVLWVGPFLEGVLTLMPEAFEGPGRPTRQEGRRGLKLFLMDITGRHARQLSGAQVTMRRDRWASLPGGAPNPLYLKGEEKLDEEPGRILNSVSVVRNQTTGLLEIMNLTPKVPVPMAPIIQVEPRYGLHYMLKGDLFEFRWVTRFPRRQEFVARFVLRAPSEGSSLVVPEQGLGVHTF